MRNGASSSRDLDGVAKAEMGRSSSRPSQQ